MADGGPMVSRSVPAIPEGKAEMRRYIEKILKDHYNDIKNLYDMTTDCDLTEKLQRDNAQTKT